MTLDVCGMGTKWLWLSLLMYTLVAPVQSLAAGGISHVFMAHGATGSVQQSELSAILQNHDNAYTVGACYADSGYISGATYGELSHWDDFIFAFADHLKRTFANPARDAPRQVAFLMGCVTHRVSDEIFHWVFLDEVAGHDFGGDWHAAHAFGDLGLDIIVTVDQNLWFSHANRWYVPVTDLVATYRDMGYAISTAEIVSANAIYYFAGLGERLMAPVTYSTYKRRGPWAAKHYLDDTHGGYRNASAASAHYMDALWAYLQHASAERPSIPRYSRHVHEVPVPPLTPLSPPDGPKIPGDMLVEQGTDGSVTILQPTINNARAYLDKLDSIVQAALR